MASRSLAVLIMLSVLCLVLSACRAARDAEEIAITGSPTPATAPSHPTSAASAPTAAPSPSRNPPTRRPSSTPTDAPKAVPTVQPVAVVQSAVLNLRSGPGTGFAVAGKATRGNELYPVAQVSQCQWLQVSVPGRAGLVWVAGTAKYVRLSVPCAALRATEATSPTRAPATPRSSAVATRRPAAAAAVPTRAPAVRSATGLIDRYAPERGRGELLIKNGTDSDGVVILLDSADKPAQAAYIRAAESFQMTDIADGAYRLYFTKGEGWDPARREFTRNVTRQRFADTLTFATTATQYTGFEVTLYGVAGGNAATQNVPAAEFPALP